MNSPMVLQLLNTSLRRLSQTSQYTFMIWWMLRNFQWHCLRKEFHKTALRSTTVGKPAAWDFGKGTEDAKEDAKADARRNSCRQRDAYWKLILSSFGTYWEILKANESQGNQYSLIMHLSYTKHLHNDMCMLYAVYRQNIHCIFDMNIYIYI